MYCGACTRDMSLVRGLMSLGHDVQIIPLYTPLRDDMLISPTEGPLFLGGINAYLQQLSPIFARIPRKVMQIFDHPKLLTRVADFAIQTDARKLGAMTLSVLQGSDGRQRVELARLVNYLRESAKPQLLSITNSLLSGVAPIVKEALEIPVVCSLQGEDIFIESLPDEYQQRVCAQISKNSQAIDLFIATAEIQAEKMSALTGIPREKIAVAHAGIDCDIFSAKATRPPQFTIGYLSVITPAKGLDILLDTFSIVLQNTQLPIRLRIAGRVLAPRYWKEIQAKIAETSKMQIEYLDELTLIEKIEFLQQSHLIVCPTRIPEARGMVALEAQAAGTPVIVPDHGVFPEMLAKTGGGSLVAVDDPAALAAEITRYITHPTLVESLGQQGRAGVGKYYSQSSSAVQVESLMMRLLEVDSTPIGKTN